MALLTEDKIKLASLRFLKSHYKFRPRIGPTTAHFDMKSEEGIIADGHLYFVTEEGEQFLATFEATSDQIFEEVKYKPELRILFWDSLAAGFITAALTFLYGYLKNQFTIREVGWPMTLSIVFLGGMIGFWSYRFLVKGRHRYRYIYAVEQFKRYHADEQWIAISNTIFQKPLRLKEDDLEEEEEDFLEELKRQCVDFGIGLLTVSKNESVQMLISPARKDVFQNKRRMIHFVAQNIKKGKSWGRRLSDRGRNGLDKIFGRSKNSTSLQRYRRSFYKQILICGISIALMSFLFYRELQDLPMNYVNKKDFQREVLAKVDSGDIETSQYIADSNSVLQEEGISAPYLHVETNQTPDKTTEKIRDLDTWKINLNAKAGGSNYLQSEEEVYSSYDCERLFNFDQELFLIKYALLPDFASAKQELGRLAKNNINGNILWLGCFEKQKYSYAVYFDLLHTDFVEAGQSLKVYQDRLEEARFPNTELRLVKIVK